jgi:ParB-like chromosome segregation protein Spo0J
MITEVSTRPLAVVYRDLRELLPYARNARTHPADQIRKIRASLARFGWTNPMLIADDTMIAGHARLSAALLMAHEGEAIKGATDPWQGPTIDLSHLTATERRAYVIADNRLAMDGGWDRALLMDEMKALSMDNFDVSLTGFPKDQLDVLLGRSTAASPMLDGTLRYQVVIECPDGERQQADLIADLQARGLAARPLIL